MKTLIFLLLPFMAFAQDFFNDQDQQPTCVDYPDTVRVRYLTKSTDYPVIKRYAREIVMGLKEQGILAYSVITERDGRWIYEIKVIGYNRCEALPIVRQKYKDAYHVDKRGWRVRY